jgi:pyrroloquinoline quinone biosynthesis protein E
MAIMGDATATDPACELSPHHARLLALAEQDSAGSGISYEYRGRAARAKADAR